MVANETRGGLMCGAPCFAADEIPGAVEKEVQKLQSDVSAGFAALQWWCGETEWWGRRSVLQEACIADAQCGCLPCSSPFLR